MKLKSELLLHDFDGTHLAVPTGDLAKSFNGFIRNNDTGNAIFHLLQKETTESEIVDEMCKKYDAPKEVIAQSVNRLINQLRDENLLDE